MTASVNQLHLISSPLLDIHTIEKQLDCKVVQEVLGTRVAENSERKWYYECRD